MNMEILDVGLGELVYPDIAKDATEPPLVLEKLLTHVLEGIAMMQVYLILDVATIASLIHFNVEHIA